MRPWQLLAPAFLLAALAAPRPALAQAANPLDLAAALGAGCGAASLMVMIAVVGGLLVSALLTYFALRFSGVEAGFTTALAVVLGTGLGAVVVLYLAGKSGVSLGSFGQIAVMQLGCAAGFALPARKLAVASWGQTLLAFLLSSALVFFFWGAFFLAIF